MVKVMSAEISLIPHASMRYDCTSQEDILVSYVLLNTSSTASVNPGQMC